MMHLFAALDIQSGKVIGLTRQRRRAQEFCGFLDTIERNVPADLDIHFVPDNASTHKAPLIHAWLAKRPRYHLHFTPASASWVNTVEGWFALLTRRQLQRGALRCTNGLDAAIHRYIGTNNADPRPFVWTKSADAILDSIKRSPENFRGADVKKVLTQSPSKARAAIGVIDRAGRPAVAFPGCNPL